MTDGIGSVRLEPAIAPQASPQAAAAGAASFGESLASLLDTVESSSQSANRAVEHMLNGTGDVHEAMIALQRAELTLQLTVQLRNKLVQAYQDIMRMPV